MQQFTSSYFMRNRKKLRTLIDEVVPIVLTAHTQMQCTADMAYPFRQDTNFWYVTGCDDADVVYLFDGNEEYLILPRDNAIRDVFDGSIEIDKLKAVSGIANIVDNRTGSSLLKAAITKHKRVATLPPMTPLQTHYGIAPNPARSQLLQKLKRWQKGLEIVDVRLLFAEMRMIKTPER